MNDLGTGGPVGLAVLTGLIAIETGVHVARALHALVRHEAERTAAHDLGQRLERILARQPLRHHERRLDRGLAERRRQQRERPAQPKTDGAVVRRRQFVGCGHQLGAEPVAGRPSANARDAIARQHALAVMP